MYFAAALEADGGVELLRGSVIRCPSTAQAVERYIFLQYSCEGQYFPRDAPPAILRTDIDLGYLGHIFVGRTIFSAERRRSRRAVTPLPSATMTISRLFAEARMPSSRSLALTVELCIETLKLSCIAD